MSNTSSSSKQNNEDQLISLIEKIKLFESYPQYSKIKIAKNSKIIEYDMGRPISDGDIIPNSVQIILDGEARLIGKENNQKATIAKLGKGTIIGLASILREKSCEQVNASSKVITLSINDNFILELYKEEKLFAEWCKSHIIPNELYGLAEELLKNTANSNYNEKTLFNILYKKCSNSCI